MKFLLKRKILVLLILFQLGFIHTYSQNHYKKNISSPPKVDSLNIPSDSSTQYFPFQILDKMDSAKYRVYLKNYSSMLYALHEPLLYNKYDSGEVYRFTWLRYKYNPVSIRFENISGKIRMYIKESNGAGCCFPGKIIRDTIIELTIKHWNKFSNYIKKINFWESPIFINDESLHGSSWILESNIKDSYYFIRRMSPRNNKFSKCCMYLVKLSGLIIPEKEKQ